MVAPPFSVDDAPASPAVKESSGSAAQLWTNEATRIEATRRSIRRGGAHDVPGRK
jgi:hypothetical protein